MSTTHGQFKTKETPFKTKKICNGYALFISLLSGILIAYGELSNKAFRAHITIKMKLCPLFAPETK